MRFPMPLLLGGIELPPGYKFVHSKFAPPHLILIKRPDGEIGWLDTEKKVCVSLPTLAEEIQHRGETE